MEESKSGLYIVSIVGVVAIVGIVMILIGGGRSQESGVLSGTDSGDNVGQAGVGINGAINNVVSVTYNWTAWFNRDTPGGTGDWESRSSFSGVCSSPIAVQCQTANGGYSAYGYVAAGTDYTKTRQVVTCNTNGLVCLNSLNNNTCLDYKIRFQCPIYTYSNSGNPVIIPVVNVGSARCDKIAAESKDVKNVDVGDKGQCILTYTDGRVLIR